MPVTVLVGPQVYFAQMLVRQGALALEIKGLRRRGRSVYSIIKQEHGLKGSKTRVLKQYEDLIESTYGPLAHRYTERRNG